MVEVECVGVIIVQRVAGTVADGGAMTADAVRRYRPKQVQ